MTKELSFDDDDAIYAGDEMFDDDDLLMDSKIPIGRFAKIIDEYEENVKGDIDDDEEINLDSLGLH